MKDNLASAWKKIKEEDWESYVDLDAEFHEILAKASGSERLQNLIQALRADMVRFRIKSLHHADLANLSPNGHHRILTAISERNESEAKKAVLEHLENSKKYIMLHAFSREHEK